MDTSKKKLGSAYPVRFTEETEIQIDMAARALGLAKQDIIRMACAIGLRQLASINYDIEGAVMERAKTMQHSHEDGLALAAEQPRQYKAKRRSA